MDLNLAAAKAANCDAALSATAASCSGTRCTTGPCPLSAWGTTTCACFEPVSGGSVPQDCLDEGAAVQGAAYLWDAGIRMLVAGFELPTSTSAMVETLNETGQAGMGALPSTTTGNGYFDATSAVGVQEILTSILGSIWLERAEFTVARPPPPGIALLVLVTLPLGGIVQLDPTQFSYDPTTSILPIVDGAIANQILASIPSHPSNIDIAYFVPLEPIP